MVTEDPIYRDLQKHLDKLPIGFPLTKSGVEIRILKHLFTPEEAELATQLSMMPEPLEVIHKRIKIKETMPIDDLQQILGRMVRKGAISAKRNYNQIYYYIIPFAVGMYELQVNRLTKDFAQDANLYLHGEFGEEMYRTKIPQMRTIPVRKSINMPEKFEIGTYDSIRDIVQNIDGPIGVLNCICRQNRNVIGEKCSKTDLQETCLVFRETAEQCIKWGIGRAITKEGALGILEKAEGAGLVIQPENTQFPSFVCCCCGDCCGILTTVKRFPHPAESFATNFYAEVDSELCTGCETCVSRCQLDAITIVNGLAIVNRDRCIGCGNCTVICEFEASRLIKKEVETVPPKDKSALFRRIMAKKSATRI